MNLRMLLIVSLLIGCYFLFAGQIGETEAIAAIPAVAAACGFALLHRRAAARQLSFRGVPWRLVTLRPLKALLTDTARVGLQLFVVVWRRPRSGVGRVVQQPFQAGQSANDAGRAALTTLGATLAPDGFVLRIAGEDNTMLLHQLAPIAPPNDSRWPL